MADEKLASPVEDQELEDLLDSALKDFNKEQKVYEVDEKKESSAAGTNEENNILQEAADQFKEEVRNLLKNGLKDCNKEQTVGKGDEKKKSSAPRTDENTSETIEDGWTTNAIGEAADQFEENLRNLIENGADSELGTSFKKVAQTLAGVVLDDGNTDKDGTSADFDTVIAQALNDLSATSETLQNEADIPEMLGQASMDLMQGMLQHLLSKEILYPSLKELVDKYPEWLEGKKTSLSPNDLQRFNKQLELMKRMCYEVEKEKDEDTKETKKKRFEMLMSLMYELQGCGQLPEELVGEQTMPFQVDAEGDPTIPNLVLQRGVESLQNCRLM